MWFSNIAGLCRLSNQILFIDNHLTDGLPIGVYPNPSSEKLYISNLVEQSRVNICSLNGVILFSKILNQGTDFIDIQNLKSGTYILNINSKSQNKSVKFIKK